MYKTIYTEVEVDVDLSEFSTEDLIEELESRGHLANTNTNELLDVIWQKRRLGQDYSREIDLLIYSGLGKVI